MPESTKRTIGVDFSLKKVKAQASDFIDDSDVEDQEVTLQLWDFAGEDRFRSILPYYVHGTHGVLLGFDLTDPESLESLSEWLEIIRKFLGITLSRKVPILLIGMKDDLESNISEEKINNFVKAQKLVGYTTTSAKNGHNVESAFKRIAREIMISTQRK